MKRWILLALAASLVPAAALAEPAVLAENAVMHSQHAVMDPARRSSTLTGNVRLDTETLHMRGDTLHMHSDADGFKTYTLTAAAGKTATVRKKLPGQGAGWIDGEGGKIIYEEKLQRLFVDGKVRLPAASQPQPEADGRLLAQHAVP